MMIRTWLARWLVRRMFVFRSCWPVRVAFACAVATDIMSTPGPLTVKVGAKESKREKQMREQDEARRAEAAQRAIASHLEQPVPLGCGDSSCVVAAAHGMHTNGGCRCSPRALQAAVLWYRFEYEHRVELAQLRD